MKVESVGRDKRAEINLGISREEILLVLITFFISRVNVLNRLSPYGIAFLGAYILMKGKNPYLLFSLILGLFSSKGLAGIDYSIISIVIYKLVGEIEERCNYTLIKSSLIPALIFILAKTIFTIVRGKYYLYDMILIIFEGLMIFTMTYIFSFSLPIENIKQKAVRKEKLVGSFITLALILSGFKDIELLGVVIKNVIVVVMVVYLAYKQGPLIGVSGGAILGLVSYMPSVEMPFIISLLTVGGLLAGIFRDLGKIGSILGFILGNGIVSFYINNSGTSLIYPKELLIATCLFIIASKYINIDFDEMFLTNKDLENEYRKRRNRLVTRRLENTVKLFKDLSNLFRETIEEDSICSTTELYSLIEDICNNFCTNCCKYKDCWEENYYETYQNILNIIGLVEANRLDTNEYRPRIKDVCNKSDELVEKISNYYKRLKEDYIWNQKLISQRKILAEQLENLGCIVEEMSQDIYTNPNFNEELEGLVIGELKNERVGISDLAVAESEDKELEVLVDLENNNLSLENVANIEDIVSDNLGIPLKANFSLGDINKDRKILTLTKSSRFDFMPRVSSESNSEDRISGDNYSYGEVDSTGFLAISDGMGIGKRANLESSTAIDLFEKLMEIKMDKNTIIKTINSILRARTNDEIFTTLDLGFIDLYTGRLQMLKTGAPATFIKRKDRVDIVRSPALPIGILEDVKFNIYEEYLEDGDIVIMMSDGVLDSNKDVHNQEDWMKDIIVNIDSENPAIISDRILEEAKNISRNYSTDDMTVMATKIWRRV